MPLYRVKVHVEGIVRVEAEDADVAAMIAQQAQPALSGKKLIGAKVHANTQGEVQDHSLEPQSVKQEMFGKVLN